MLSNCSALLCGRTAAEGSARERLEDDRLLRRRVAGRGPVPLLRRSCGTSAPCSRSPTTASSRSPGYDEAMRGLPRHRQFSSCNSVVGPFAHLPGAARGRRRQRHRRRAPRPAPDARAHGHDGPARPHPGAGAADAADHAEAAQGQRGLHVAPRRPAARRVRRRRALRVHHAPTPSPSPCSSSPTCSACPRRTTSASARASACSRAPGKVGAGPSDGPQARTRSAGSTSGSPRYIEDRRREPRKDVLTDLALATYPDGTTPEVTAVVRTATFLFAAGQETTARLLAAAAEAPRRAPRAAGRAARRPRRASPTSSRRCCGSRAR